MNEKTQIGIFEAGISQPGEMAFLEKVIKPEIGVFTNLGDGTSGKFCALKQKCEEKLKLFKDAKVLIYNSDNKLVDIAVKQSDFGDSFSRWGKEANCTLRISEVKKGKTSTDLRLNYQQNDFTIQIPFVDEVCGKCASMCCSAALSGL